MRLFLSAVDFMNVLLRHVVGLMLATMVVVVALQIGVRFVLPRLGIAWSAPWSEELARYLMVWCIFMGAAVAARAGALIAVDSLPDALPDPWSHRVRTFALLVTIGFFLLLLWLGLRWMEFGEGETSTVMSMPMAWVYASMPAGALVAIINIVALMLERRHERLTARAAQEAEAAASII